MPLLSQKGYLAGESLIILTKKEADRVIKSKDGTIQISLDLGKSLCEVKKEGKAVYVNNINIPLEEFSKIKEESCYTIAGGKITKLAFFSEETNLYYKLVPTKDWPTITLSSTPMHRHTQLSPKEDTIFKIREIKPIKGQVLDTCCGLGYTAIMCSKEADEVYTFERDFAVLHVAKLNPYSQELFNSKKIKMFTESIFNATSKFEDNFFDRIVHDPPTFKYSPELYSKEFYNELYRVMKNKGIIYHYAPWPQKTKNRVFYKGIIAKLNECGFERARYSEKSSGVVAVKP